MVEIEKLTLFKVWVHFFKSDEISEVISEVLSKFYRFNRSSSVMWLLQLLTRGRMTRHFIDTWPASDVAC
jgi:hypothetical protein